MCWELDDYAAWEEYLRRRQAKKMVEPAAKEPKDEAAPSESKEALHAFVGAAAESLD